MEERGDSFRMGDCVTSEMMCVCVCVRNMTCTVHLPQHVMVPRGCTVGCDKLSGLCMLDSEI